MQELIEMNVLFDGAELAARLEDALAGNRGDESDAFLLACGLGQIADDYAERDALSLATVILFVPPTIASIVRLVRRTSFAVRDLRPIEHRARRFRRAHAAVVQACADALVLGTRPDARRPRPRLPRRLAREMQKMPNCFRSFDQHPDDCARLVALFAERHPQRERPLLVVGIRTSGSFLAPLFVSHLRGNGYSCVDAITYRPGSRLLGRERRKLRGTVARGGLVLVVDDPPRTGTVLARATRELEAFGVARSAQLVLVPLFATIPPDALRESDLIVLPWTQWAIHGRLSNAHVTQEPAPPRKHVRGRTSDGHYARGVGYGYFGRYALAAARQFGAFLPRVDRIEEGLLIRDWLPEDARVARADTVLARSAGRYLGARAQGAALEHDLTLLLSRRDAAWGNIAHLLGGCFGRLRPFLRPLTGRAGRYLAQTTRPAVIDGDMKVGSFFTIDGGMRKISFEDGASKATGLGALSCDLLFDAAALLADAEIAGVAEPTFADELRKEFEREVRIESDERWLLYELVHHAIARRATGGSLDRLLAIERATSRALQRYFGPFVRGIPGSGPLCAIDIDGVLETRLLQAPAIGPDGALALRRLACHGFRPVLVTGRSLPEVTERCRTYNLAGGVAGYGAVVYDTARDETVQLLSPDAEEQLAQIRATLSELPDVAIDGSYQHTVRAYRRLQDGSHVGLPEEQVACALATAGPGVRPVRGFFQTDFVAGDIDKGKGIRTLCALLDAPLALAIGDSEADIPLLEAAERAFVPAHAPASLPGRRTRHSYQAGLLDACSLFLGHRRCPACAPPENARAATLVLAALRAIDGGRSGKLRQAAIFAGLAARS